MRDPKAGVEREGRIEISPKHSGRVILSFPPYLDTEHENLLPQKSRDSRFRRRPSYAYRKSELGLTNEVAEREVLTISELESLIERFGIPRIIMASQALPPETNSSDWLKLEWPMYNCKKWISSGAWDGAVKGGSMYIETFWFACGQASERMDLQEMGEHGGNERWPRIDVSCKTRGIG
jgi:hypothetical protein